MIKTIEGNLLAEGMKFALVVSRFNDIFSERLVGGAIDSLLRRGAGCAACLTGWASASRWRSASQCR